MGKFDIQSKQYCPTCKIHTNHHIVTKNGEPVQHVVERPRGASDMSEPVNTKIIISGDPTIPDWDPVKTYFELADRIIDWIMRNRETIQSKGSDPV